jgi:type IV pilus assembly protein PilB
VLSTLHTNDAPSAITRLTEMGIEPFLVGSAVDCVLAQRLARRLCSKCKEQYEPSADQLESLGFIPRPEDPAPTFYRPVGCPNCAKTGYKGRLALHEVMAMNEEIERLTVDRASSTQIGDVAVAGGMRLLREDGLRKAALGITSIDEIFRVVA